MACMGCGGKTLTPKKPQLAANTVSQRPTGSKISLGGKATFGKPKITRGK